MEGSDPVSKKIARIPPFEQSCQLTGDQAVEYISKDSSTTGCERIRQTLVDSDLERMHQQLFYAGRKGNISPLHHQLVLRREIILTENPRIHLVWFDRIIYIQRLPDELLNWQYFLKHICPDTATYHAATGFLLSYTALIRHPSDLEIAKTTGLISKHITWPAWHTFRSSILHNLANRNIHDRFEYGELRLGRLNQIYRMRFLGLSYFTIYRDYSSYFGDNYMTLVALFALVTVALSAMQVMTAYDRIPTDVMVVFYRFSIAALVALVACCGLLFALYVGLYLWNWALIYLRRRSRRARGPVSDF